MRGYSVPLIFIHVPASAISEDMKRLTPITSHLQLLCLSLEGGERKRPFLFVFRCQKRRRLYIFCSLPPTSSSPFGFLNSSVGKSPFAASSWSEKGDFGKTLREREGPEGKGWGRGRRKLISQLHSSPSPALLKSFPSRSQSRVEKKGLFTAAPLL